MKYLPLEASHRHYLDAKGAIVFENDGNESLAGLSWPESVLYLELLVGMLSKDLPRDISVIDSFLSMHERHTKALPELPTILEALLTLRKQTRLLS